MTRRAPLALFLAIADAALALSFRSPIAWTLIVVPAAAAPLARAMISSVEWLRPMPAAWILIVARRRRAHCRRLAGGPRVLARRRRSLLIDEGAFPRARVPPAAIGVFLAAASNPSGPHFIRRWRGSPQRCSRCGSSSRCPTHPRDAASSRSRSLPFQPGSSATAIVLLPGTAASKPRRRDGWIRQSRRPDCRSASRSATCSNWRSRAGLSCMWSADPMTCAPCTSSSTAANGVRLAWCAFASRTGHPRAGPSASGCTVGRRTGDARRDAVAAERGRRGRRAGGGQQDQRRSFRPRPRSASARSRSGRGGVQTDRAPRRAGDDDVVRACLQVPAAIDPRRPRAGRPARRGFGDAKDKITGTHVAPAGGCRTRSTSARSGRRIRSRVSVRQEEGLRAASRARR